MPSRLYMLIELLHVPLEIVSLGTWMIATQDGFLRSVAAEVQMPFVSSVFVLAGRYQSDREVVDGFIEAHGCTCKLS